MNSQCVLLITDTGISFLALKLSRLCTFSVQQIFIGHDFILMTSTNLLIIVDNFLILESTTNAQAKAVTASPKGTFYRNGGLTPDRAYNGTHGKLFYHTPSDFFSSSKAVDSDKADTAKGQYYKSRLVEKPTMWFPNRSDTNRPVQAQKRARSLKFRSLVEEGLYYPSSENKGADQLRGYREADLRLCYRLCRLMVFP